MPTAAIQHNDAASFVYVVVKDYKPATDEKGADAEKCAGGDKDAKDAKGSKDDTEAKPAPDPNALYAKSSAVGVTVTEGETAASPA